MTGPFSSFFHLRDNPFRANPDPRYLFLAQRTRESLDQIIESIRRRKGLLLLTGEVGTGKTVLLNRLMEWLDQERVPKAFIFNSHLKASEVLELILADFGIPFNANRGTALAHLHTWLQDRSCAGETPVLFVDEAQGLTLRVLEELRMLLNLETPEGSLLQIVLCGQPEFEETLKRPELRQLRQRIALRCRTAPLTFAETQGYIDARLGVAGAAGFSVFGPEAVQALAHYSRGLPRVLNALCERALLRAASEKLRPVPGRIITEAARELQYDDIGPFVPLSVADDVGFSGLFGHPSAFAGTPELSVPAVPPVADAPVASIAPSIMSSERNLEPNLQPRALAAAAAAGASPLVRTTPAASRPLVRDASPLAPRTSHAPIEFPSPVHRDLPPSEASDEMIARIAAAAKATAPSEPRIAALAPARQLIAPIPILPKKAVKPAIDFHALAKRYRLAAINNAKAAWSAIASISRDRTVQAQTRAISISQALSEQWSSWSSRLMQAATRDRKSLAFVSSLRQWLRAPVNVTRHSQAAPKTQTPVPHTAASARISAAQRIQTSSLRAARRSSFIRTSETAPRVAASILQWLQQPSQSARARKPTRASAGRLP
jgi:general secretion pathway protein A